MGVETNTGLRIGVIVDSTQLACPIHDFASDLARDLPSAEIVLMIIQDVPRPRGWKRARELYLKGGWRALTRKLVFSTVLMRFESLVLRKFPQHRNYFSKRDGQHIASHMLRVSPRLSKSGFVFRYPDDDVERIAKFGLDVIVRFGDGILKGPILTAAKHGILSFHNGDNRINRGGPAGFWEVYFKQDSTGFVLQQLTEELDGGNIVSRGNVTTQPYFLLNRAFVMRKSHPHLIRALKHLQSQGELPHVEDCAVYSDPLYRLPGVRVQLSYLFAAFIRIISHIVRFRLLGQRSRWGVGFIRGGWKNSVLWRYDKIPNPPGRMLADPFVVQEGGEDFVFVEDYGRKAHEPAYISAYKLNGRNAERIGPALVEDFHLSFPFLFRYSGQLFMCPETLAAGQIRLYRCVEFPLKWELHRVIMDDVSAVDNLIFEHKGRWWLLTNIDSAGLDEFGSDLHVFHSDDPVDGTWHPHPLNPVIVDSRRARNGGLLRDGEDICRVGQYQGLGVYGKKVTIRQVVALDELTYEEKQLCEVSPRFVGGAKGMHHFHSSGGVTVFDFLKYERMA